MLPQVLFCLLHVAIVLAQSRQQLSLNSLSSFANSSVLQLPVFQLPPSDALSVSVALCSRNLQSSLPRFFVTNNTAISNPEDGGTDVFEIQLTNGFGNWTGQAPSGGILAVQDAGQTAFEVGVSENNPMHEHLTTYPLFGDSTSNQALIFSPPFESPLPEQPPSYPNYTLPVANISLPTPPLSYPNFTLVVSPTSASLTSFPQTGCQLSQVPSAWTAINQTLWLRDEEGWRSQWLLEGLLPMTNYTVYVVQDQTKVGGPAYFNTKSASFACPIVHSLPYCPAVSYAVPTLPPPAPATAYDSSLLPNTLTTPLLEYITNFTTTLLTFPCGRDMYSPLQSCVDCQRAYRRWLCSISFPRCGEASPGSPPTSSTAAMASAAPGAQQPFSALVPQSTSTAPRNPFLPPLGEEYMALLPCFETCTALDRACPTFLGIKCPVVRFNAAASYGVGYVDSGEDGEQGGGSTGTMQDRWGNVWCNGN